MTSLKVLFEKHIVDLDNLPQIEEAFDAQLKKAINDPANILREEFGLYCTYPTIPLEGLRRIVHKYKKEGWLVNLRHYPNIYVRVSKARYKKGWASHLEEVLKQEKKAERAIKV